MTTPDENIDLSNLSDEERAALEDESPGTEAEVEAAAKAAEAKPDEPDDDAAAEAAATPESPEEEEEIAADNAPQLSGPDLTGYDEQISQLLDQRKEVRNSYRNGDLSAEEKDDQEDAINEQILALRERRNQAQFVENFNQQMAEKEYLRAIDRVKETVRERDGIDYDANPMLLQNWDLKVRALAADPANANRPGEWYLREAHKQVLAELDATAKALGYERGERRGPRTPEQALQDAVRGRRPPETGARSLSTLPAAGSDSIGNEFAHLDSLSGDELEAAVARMTPEQQERWAQQ